MQRLPPALTPWLPALLLSGGGAACAKHPSFDPDETAYCKLEAATPIEREGLFAGTSAQELASRFEAEVRAEDGIVVRRRATALSAQVATLGLLSPHCPPPGDYLLVSLILQYEMTHPNGVAWETSVGRLQLAVDGPCPEHAHVVRFPGAGLPPLRHDIAPSLEAVARREGLEGPLRWKLGPHDLRPTATLADFGRRDIVAAMAEGGGHSFVHWELPPMTCDPPAPMP